MTKKKTIEERVKKLEQTVEEMQSYLDDDHDTYIDIEDEEDSSIQILRPKAYVIYCDPKPINGNKGPRLYWKYMQLGFGDWYTIQYEATKYPIYQVAKYVCSTYVGLPPEKYGKPQVQQIVVDKEEYDKPCVKPPQDIYYTIRCLAQKRIPGDRTKKRPPFVWMTGDDEDDAWGWTEYEDEAKRMDTASEARGMLIELDAPSGYLNPIVCDKKGNEV